MTTIPTMSVAPRRVPAAGAIAAVVVSLGLATPAAQALTPEETALIALGKNAFFDDKLSHPSHKQACASCHDAARGWVLPNSKINETTVVAPGAAPHALGNIKVPSNAYASFSPPFAETKLDPPLPPFRGGNFWDGRAEGCGATTKPPCPVGTGPVSETIRPADLPNRLHAGFLGPTADQALNPFPNTVEQNIREKNVCQVVKTAKYKKLFFDAWGKDIDCSPNPKSKPAYSTSFKGIAVALAAWQSSEEVNSFSSKRDKALKADDNGHFPLDDFFPNENRGHDLFYGITSELNPPVPPSTRGKNARCTACHNGVPAGDTADPAKGEAPRELYTDNAFHNIGVPFNREIPGVPKGRKEGLSSHVPVFNENLTGLFKTPTLRNVAKGVDGGFVKAYAHNGWFKRLETLVHFYNTRDVLPRCEDLGLTNATEKEATGADGKIKCWPPAEFPETQAGFVIGNLRLDEKDEADIVAYLKTLTDLDTPEAP